ncbi:MAG TPA: hypothetical protein VMN78_02950 [Longimicrobiales bacterium]|nr:hypothetical protein [Longimicrobiales bacterium]
MSEDPRGLDELRARVQAAGGASRDGVASGDAGSADAIALAGAAATSLAGVLDLIAAGRGMRETGSGLNPASKELLVADAVLTEAAARAATSGTRIESVLGALGLEELSERARAIDEAAS